MSRYAWRTRTSSDQKGDGKRFWRSYQQTEVCPEDICLAARADSRYHWAAAHEMAEHTEQVKLGTLGRSYGRGGQAEGYAITALRKRPPLSSAVTLTGSANMSERSRTSSCSTPILVSIRRSQNTETICSSRLSAFTRAPAGYVYLSIRVLWTNSTRRRCRQSETC